MEQCIVGGVTEEAWRSFLFAFIHSLTQSKLKVMFHISKLPIQKTRKGVA